MQKKTGSYFMASSLIITVFLWILSKESINEISDKPFLSISQILSLLGSILLVWSIILSSKFRFIERLFGGLDKVYRIHRIIAGIGFIFILNHPIFLAISALPSYGLAFLYLLSPEANLSWILGRISLFIFSSLVILTLFVKLPYHIWKISHKFMGIGMIVAFFHIVLVSSDVSRFLPLRIWMIFWLLASISSYIFAEFFRGRLFVKNYEYLVDSINIIENIVEIYMKPASQNSILQFTPGQFVFVTFYSDAVSSESHPFSLSSSKKDGLLRISVKRSGDYTDKLINLKSGDLVKIDGPFGVFGDRFAQKTSTDVIFIAGGIGVTPLLSMVKSDSGNREIDFYYCVSLEKDLVYEKEINDSLKKYNVSNYHRQISDKNGKIRVEKILKSVHSLDKKMIFLCGPISMMKSLRDQFIEAGASERNIIFEDFSFR